MRKTKIIQGFTAAVLAAAMLFSDLPVTSFAEDLSDGEKAQEQEIPASIVTLSDAAYEALSEDAKSAYDEMLSGLVRLGREENGPGQVVFAEDENGGLYVSYNIPYAGIYDTDVSGEAEPALEEETSVEEEPQPAEEPPAAEENIAPVAENMDLLEDWSIEDEEEEYSAEDNSFDSTFTYVGDDYFTSDLTETELAIYNAAVGRLTNGSNYFRFKVDPTTDVTGLYSSVAKALSLVATTYVNKLDFLNLAAGAQVTSAYVDHKWQYKISFKKSSYYNAKFPSRAASKIKTCVNEAYDYATAHYEEESFTYGMVEYLENKLCSLAEENETGLATDEETMNTKEYYYCHSAYGPLLFGYGVCEGYAKAMSMMLDRAGITNIYAVSGSHAFVYVLMNDDKWYIVDPMLDDAGATSSGTYLLCGNLSDADHTADGVIFSVNECADYSLSYPEISESAYTATAESLSLNKLKTAVAKGKTTKLSVGNSYYASYKKTWSSGNTKTATVTQAGKITGVRTGQTTISCTIAGRSASADLYVYNFTGLSFTNGKSKCSKTYVNSGSYTLNSKGVPTFTGSDTVSLTVKQSSKVATAYELYLYDEKLSLPTAKSSNASVVAVEATGTITGDTISFRLTPKSIGTATITIKFGGKTATLNYTVNQQLLDDWFQEEPSVTSCTYNGTAKTPRVYKDTTNTTHPVPTGLTYSTRYSDNINAGTATITLVGTKRYSGTVTRTFTINPINMVPYTSYTCTASRTYNGTVQNPTITANYYPNKKTKQKLRFNKEFGVTYTDSHRNTYTSLTDAGTYNLRIAGINNYTGVIALETYTINKVNAENLTASCKDLIYTGSNLAGELNITVKYGNYVIPQTDTQGRSNYSYEVYSVSNSNVYTNRTHYFSATGTYTVVVTYAANNIDNSTKSTDTFTFKVKTSEKE